MRQKFIIVVLVLLVQTLTAQNDLELKNNEWELSFEDSGTNTNLDWEDNWFLDGNDSRIEYTDGGLLLRQVTT